MQTYDESKQKTKEKVKEMKCSTVARQNTMIMQGGELYNKSGILERRQKCLVRLGAEVTCGRRLLQTSASETGNARLPIKERVLGTMTRSEDAEHKPGRSAWDSRTRPCRCDGGMPLIERWAKTATLKRMRLAIPNQCSETSASVTCSESPPTAGC